MEFKRETKGARIDANGYLPRVTVSEDIDTYTQS